MNKKGQSLSMNTVIIAILVIIVLVVIVAFFVGGTSSVVSRIKAIFIGSAGSNLVEAKNLCEGYCDSASQLTPEEQRVSPYCTKYQTVDIDGDGSAEKSTKADTKGKALHFYCSAVHKTGTGASVDTLDAVDGNFDSTDHKGINHLGVICPGVTCK